jgi:hypothetical protein
MKLSEEIERVVTEVAKLQALANEKGINIDFERVLIMLETQKTSASVAESFQ